MGEATSSGTDTQPDITRPGVGIAAVSQWESTDAANQRARLDQLTDARTSTRPHGLLSLGCFTGTSSVKDFGPRRGSNHNDNHNGKAASASKFMTYEQWTTDDAYRAYLDTREPSSLLADAVVAAAAVATPDSAEYRLYRSHRNAISEDTMPSPRNIVINTVEFDGPDEHRLRQWIDDVVDALEAEPNGIPGLISANLQVSTTGDRVLNFAEWTSEQAYAEALANGPRGVGQTDLPEWRKIKDFPGVKGDKVNQYALYRAWVSPVAAARSS